MEIISYGSRETENFDLYGIMPKSCSWRSLERIVRRKMDILLSASKIEDLKVPPNNRFKSLQGELEGYSSIRINDQWRIIFKITRWNKFEDVEIIDYH